MGEGGDGGGGGGGDSEIYLGKGAHGGVGIGVAFSIHVGGEMVFFYCIHYRVRNNNYTYVICRGIILGGRILVHPCGRGKSTVCDA